MKILKSLSTKGHKYRIEAFDCEDGSFSIREYINGVQQAASVGITSKEKCMNEFNRRVSDASTYDGINYSVRR